MLAEKNLSFGQLRILNCD